MKGIRDDRKTDTKEITARRRLLMFFLLFVAKEFFLLSRITIVKSVFLFLGLTSLIKVFFFFFFFFFCHISSCFIIMYNFSEFSMTFYRQSSSSHLDSSWFTTFHQPFMVSSCFIACCHFSLFSS